MGNTACSRCGTTLTGSSSDSSGLCERCALELKPTLEAATPEPGSQADGLQIPSSFDLHDSGDEARGAAGSALQPGETLGTYTIEAELGRGGMAVVYRATQAGLDRQVALKVLSEGPTTSPERVERFLREARAAAKLTHPNIVPVHEVGEDRGVRFLAMEFVDGLTLDEAIRRESLDWRRTAEVVRDCARALHYAHGQGVVHRDVKPGNIMLEAGTGQEPAGPRAYVTDFGLARVEGGGALTADGTAIGTPAYMSPEQAAGDQSAIGPPTDVYALGAVLYEALTGRPPATGESVLEILHAVQSVEPPPVRRLSPATPADLATVTEKAIAKDLHDRYRSASELADELDRVLTGDSILARPPGPLQRGLRAARRHPLLVASSAVAAAALLIGFGIWVQLQETRSGLEEANRETAAAMNAAAQARIAKETRDRQLQEARPVFERAESKLALARNARRSGDDARARDALAQSRELVNEALAIAPHFAEAWLISARLHSLSGRHGEALADYGAAIEHNPSLSQAYYERVRLQFDRHFTVHVAAGLQDHQARQAISGDLAQLKALEARPAQAHAAEAMALLLAADFAAAEAAVLRSLEEDPYFADAFALRAGAKMGQGYFAIINADMKTAGRRFREALTDFESAVRHGADPDQILAGRALVLAEMGRHDKALADAQRFVELDPADADRWFLQARLLKIAGKKDDAAEALAKARELADDTPEHHLQAAAVLLADKMRLASRQNYQEMFADLVEAKRELDWVVQHAPNHPVARFYRAVVNSVGGDLASSAADLRVFLNEVPADSNYRAKAQGMLDAIERQLEGQARVERQVQQQQDLLGAQEQAQRAFKLMTQGRIDEAEAIYRKVIADVTKIEASGPVLEKVTADRRRSGHIRIGDLEIEIDESGLSRVVAGRLRAGAAPDAKPAPGKNGSATETPAADAEPGATTKAKRKAEEPADKIRRAQQQNVLREVQRALKEEMAKLPAEARREIERSRRQMLQRNRSNWGREMASQVKQVSHYNVACALALRHAKQPDAKLLDEAFAHLEQAVANGFSEYRHMASDRDFTALRGDPRFKQILDACAEQAKREAAKEAAERKARHAAYKQKRAAHKSEKKSEKKSAKNSAKQSEQQSEKSERSSDDGR